MEIVIEHSIELQIRDKHSILSRIGDTPLLRIRKIAPSSDEVQIYVKAEWLNPGGSVKDRAALNMLVEAENRGDLTGDKTIIDATSGNTGIAYALIGRAMGYDVTLVLPANASEERKRILRAYGAELVFTDPLEGTDGAQRVAREIVAAGPSKYFYPDQYNNPENWKAHYKTTAKEIWDQSGQRVTHFVSGLGTTGTFVGISRRLKELDPMITCISVQPDSPLHGIEGLKHLPTAQVPGIYDQNLADGNIYISTDEAYEMVQRLAREEGLLVGASSGAAMEACLKIARQLTRGMIVTIFPDGGEKYLSDNFWKED